MNELIVFLAALSAGICCGCVVFLILNALRKYAPSPADLKESGVDADGEPVEIACDASANTAAICFKTVADPFVGKMSYFKVASGELKADGNYINARTTVYMGVDVSGTEQFSIAFSHSHWNRFDCCDDTVSNTQLMVIEPSLFSQQPSGAQNVCHIPSSTGHSSWQRPNSSTRLVSPRCPHSSACTRNSSPLNPSRSSTISSSSCKLVPVITSQPGFCIASVEATRNGVPPSKSVRKTMPSSQSSWA